MDYLIFEIGLSLLAAFAIGFVAGRLLRTLSPAHGHARDRVAMAERLANEREAEVRRLRTDVAAMTEKMRQTEAEAAAAQAEVARTGVQLNATRTDLSRKIVALEEELTILKRPRVTPAPPPPPEQPAVAAAAPVAVAAAPPAPAPVAQVESAPVVAPPAPPPAPLPPDDLKEIAGIGPILEHTLQSLGLRTYAQIAKITPEDVAMLIVKVDSSIAERVLRERWVEQARDLHAKKYGRAA